MRSVTETASWLLNSRSCNLDLVGIGDAAAELTRLSLSLTRQWDNARRCRKTPERHNGIEDTTNSRCEASGRRRQRSSSAADPDDSMNMEIIHLAALIAGDRLPSASTPSRVSMLVDSGC